MMTRSPYLFGHHPLKRSTFMAIANMEYLIIVKSHHALFLCSKKCTCLFSWYENLMLELSQSRDAFFSSSTIALGLSSQMSFKNRPAVSAVPKYLNQGKPPNPRTNLTQQPCEMSQL
jgi:hypothetical protein